MGEEDPGTPVAMAREIHEAIAETYIPLLDIFEGLERDGVDWRMTMSVTPTLA